MNHSHLHEEHILRLTLYTVVTAVAVALLDPGVPALAEFFAALALLLLVALLWRLIRQALQHQQPPLLPLLVSLFAAYSLQDSGAASRSTVFADIATIAFLSALTLGAFRLWSWWRAPQGSTASASTGPRPSAAIRYPAESVDMDFHNIIGMTDLKAQLKEAADLYASDDKNGVLLHGLPGGGKTLVAKAFAGEIGLPIISVSIGDLASKWVNDTTQNVGHLFRDAIAQEPCVLFVDEIDSLISERVKGSGYEERGNIVNAFLTGSVDIRTHEVFLIAATNLIDHLDPAAVREGRFDFKIEVPLPDSAARRGLIEKVLGEYGATVDPETLNRLVRRWAGFNVPRILEVTTRACRDAGMNIEESKKAGETKTLGWIEFYTALRAVQGRKATVPEDAKKLSDLFLDADARERLESIVMQIKEIDQVETMGGSIPRGLVFYGPPGTGKTTVAAALSAETGWAFISKSGSDLFQNGAIDELRKEANNLRPCIVFLDEADDILANRSMSGYKSVTNGILTLVDGAGGNLPDVVWVAATNDVSSMDAAALRGGRFEQKILFGPPSGETLMKMLVDWTERNAKLVDSNYPDWSRTVAAIVTDMTLADLGSTLTSARNIAIARALRAKIDTPSITVADVRMAAAEIRS